MNPSDCTIYAACIPGEKIRYETRSTLVPVMGGACKLSKSQRESLRRQGYKFDDENSTLSELNSQWADLSSILWVLLNAKEDNIGTSQYRRTWEEPDGKWYKPDTLYIPESIEFKYSLGEQVKLSHRAFNAVLITKTIAASGNWLFTKEEIVQVWKQNVFYGCLMARGPRDEYRKFVTILFDALFPIWNRYQDHFMTINGYDTRAIAFIAERVMTAMVLHRERLFPGMKIETAPIRFIPDETLVRKELPGAQKHRTLRQKRAMSA